MLNNNFKYVYIDESGNFGYKFDKGASTHFIITAVIISPENLENIRKEMLRIQQKYFSGGEIKSSGIGSDYIRRIKILQEISNLDFDVLSYVIDKQKINRYKSQGLTFKRSFLKFSNNLLHKELKFMYDSLSIVSDEHGNCEFMNSFVKYFYQEELMLLSRYDFSFENSKDEVCIQLADLICGTIATKYENNDKNNKYKVFLNFLKNRILRIIEYPIDYEEYLENIDFSKVGEYDKKISKHCIRLATEFIRKEEDFSSDEEIDQIEIVKFLLFKLRYEDDGKYYNSYILREHLKKVHNRSYKSHKFKTSIIAKLRDKGVIISSSNSGYKIPINECELLQYTRQTVHVVHPMLERLRKCRKDILALTSNDLDIVGANEYRDLKDYFEYIKDDRL